MKSVPRQSPVWRMHIIISHGQYFCNYCVLKQWSNIQLCSRFLSSPYEQQFQVCLSYPDRFSFFLGDLYNFQNLYAKPSVQLVMSVPLSFVFVFSFCFSHAFKFCSILYLVNIFRYKTISNSIHTQTFMGTIAGHHRINYIHCCSRFLSLLNNFPFVYHVGGCSQTWNFDSLRRYYCTCNDSLAHAYQSCPYKLVVWTLNYHRLSIFYITMLLTLLYMLRLDKLP